MRSNFSNRTYSASTDVDVSDGRWARIPVFELDFGRWRMSNVWSAQDYTPQLTPCIQITCLELKFVPISLTQAMVMANLLDQISPRLEPDPADPVTAYTLQDV